MHELGIADSIIKAVIQKMEEAGYARVDVVALRIGALTDIVPDALEFGFDVLTRDTVLENTELKIETVPVRGTCKECGRGFEVNEFIFICPNCESRRIEMSSGDELEIAYIEVDDGT